MGDPAPNHRPADRPRAARRAGRVLRAAGLIVAACAASPVAPHAEPPAPGQAIGYANPDKSGASRTWDLPVDKPYLAVPVIGPELAGRVALVETGPEVGAVLFQQPYFAARDAGCQLDVGTDARPDMRWLGATARLVPAPPEQRDDPAPGPAPDPGAAGGYGSLILYRTDLGPPPGALLLDRRPAIGLRCANPVHKTVYNRLFVPVAEAPEATRCFDLRGDYPAGGTATTALDFVRSDRLILLMPGDADERYARIQHDVTVSLYDGLACRGQSVSFASRAQIGRDIRLDQYEFRDRARSIRIVYDGGNAEPFLVRAPPPAPPAVVQAPAAAPAPPPSLLTTTRPIADPAVAGRAEPAPKAAPAPVPVPPPAAAQESPAKDAPAGNPPVVAARPAPTATGPQAIVPSTPVEAPVEAPVPAPMPTPAPAPAESAPAKPAPAQAAPAPVAAAPTAPRTVQPAMPKLSPVLPSETGAPVTAAAGLRRFEYPTHDIYRLNACLTWRRDCGAPAAAAWCKAQGFARVVDWALDEAIGANFPSVVIGDGRVCAEPWCSGFRTITCGR